MVRYDCAKTFKIGNDIEVLHARGILTCDIPGLAKTRSGKFVTPTLRTDEEGHLQNYFFSNGKPNPLYTFKGNTSDDGEEIEQPNMVGVSKEKKILLWVNDKGTDTWFQLEAWETMAKKMNRFFGKGDRVVVLAHKSISKGAVAGKQEVIWQVDDIAHIEDDVVASKTRDERSKSSSN